MNFTQAHTFLLSLQNMRPPHEHAISETSTERFSRLGRFLSLCDNPHIRIPSYIHVTGTSGKGSTATMLAAIYQAHGKKTGLLTSPHISHITERWQINNRPMTKKNFTAIVEILIPIYDTFLTNDERNWITYHELLTMIGFIYFAQEQVDVAVLEVGMGGDLDATNIIPDKSAAIITTVGADHLDLLGPTLDDVARHKAGIITVPTTIVSGVTDPTHRVIIEETAHRVSSHVIYPEYEQCSVTYRTLTTTTFTYQNHTYKLNTFGAHQIRNALLAITAAHKLTIPVTAIQRGLARARFPLRFETMSHNPLCIIDGAHNPEKITATITAAKEYLELVKTSTGMTPRLYLVIGFSRGKDYEDALQSLSSLHPAHIACTRFTDNPFRAALSPNIIASTIKKILPTTSTSIHIRSHDALSSVYQQASPNDCILITGSIFLSGELRPLIKKYLKK